MAYLESASKLGGSITFIEHSGNIVWPNEVHIAESDLKRFPYFATLQKSQPIREFTVPDAVLDGTFEGLYVQGAFVEEFAHGLTAEKIASASVAAADAVPDTSGWHTLIGYIWPASNYYHWMVQALPSIDAMAGRRTRHEVQLALPTLTAWQEQSLAKLGLGDLPRLRIERGRQYRINTAVFTDFATGRPVYTRRFLQYVGSIKRATHLTASAGKRIYATRRDANFRRLANEDRVIDIMKDYGFSIVAAGEYSLDDQIGIFHNAEIVVGPHGAALTNVMFCNQGTILYEFMNRNYPVPCMSVLAQNMGMRYYVDFFDQTPQPSPQFEHWVVDVDLVRRRLDQIIQ